LLISGGLVLKEYFETPGSSPQVRSWLRFMTLVGLSIIPMLLFMTLKQFTDGLGYTKTAMMLHGCHAVTSL
jgi:MATE family multidrug resistance protein